MLEKPNSSWKQHHLVSIILPPSLHWDKISVGGQKNGTDVGLFVKVCVRLNRILLLELNVVNILNGCLKHLKTRWMWRKVHGLIVCQWSINRVNTGAKSQLEDTRWMWREVSLLSTRVDCATLQRTLCYCTTAKLRAPPTNFLNKTTVLSIRHICVLESTGKYSRVYDQKQM